MTATEDFQQWLAEQPLDVVVELGDDRIYLKRYPAGAELGAYMMDGCTPAQIQEALRQGFASALVFDAGLACSPDGKSLLLTQWLPGVNSWAQAAQPLESLLNQLDTWRAILAPEQVKRDTIRYGTTESRLRTLLAKGR